MVREDRAQDLSPKHFTEKEAGAPHSRSAKRGSEGSTPKKKQGGKKGLLPRELHLAETKTFPHDGLVGAFSSDLDSAGPQRKQPN